jgi:MFS family permease
LGGRRTLLITQVVSALVAATLAGLDLDGALNAWGLGVGALVGGLAFTLALPARNVTVQRLVPKDKLKPAYAMDTVSYNLGRTLAPLVIIGLALAKISLAWAFAANAASFIIFSLILWRIHMRAEAEPERRSRVQDGFRIAFSDRRILVLLLMVAAVTMADDPILVLGPALASHLHAPTDFSSFFIAARSDGTGRAGPVHAAVCTRADDVDRRYRCAGGRGKLPDRKLGDACRVGRTGGPTEDRRRHGCLGDRLGRQQAIRVLA